METVDEYRIAIARQLRAELTAAGLSVRDAAPLVGISEPAFYRYLRGDRDMPMTVAIRTAQVAGVDLITVVERAKDRLEFRKQGSE